MNAQIIHQTESPLVIEWMRWIQRDRAERVEALHDLTHDLSEQYGEAPVGHRVLIFQSGLVGGFEPNDSYEAAPHGWQLSEIWGGFVPDVDTEVGRVWQLRIEKLPAMDTSFDCSAVGVPPAIALDINGSEPVVLYPSFSSNEENDVVYVTWESRLILRALQVVLPSMDADGVFGWSEMLRSEWYALVERSEDIAEFDALQGE
jgi:hypothetical protein